MACKVYETSACWSVLLRDGAQETSILSQLPQILLKVKQPPTPDEWIWSPVMALVYLIHLLRNHYPSQTDFTIAIGRRRHLRNSRIDAEEASRSIFHSFPSENEQARVVKDYATTLATALRRSDHFALTSLLQPALTNPSLKQVISHSQARQDTLQLDIKALSLSLDALRATVRVEMGWKCLHAAYREVTTSPWLNHRLLLDGKEVDAAKRWMIERVDAAKGDVASKEGTDGRIWILVRGGKATTG